MDNPLELQDGQVSDADAAVIATMVAMVSAMTGEYYDSGDAMDQHHALREIGEKMVRRHYRNSFTHLPMHVFDVVPEDVGGGCIRLTIELPGLYAVVSVFDTSVDLWRSRAHLEDYDGTDLPLMHTELTQHEEES